MPAPTFLTCARAAHDLLRSRHVADAWDHESALPGYTVGGLAGHLGRAVLTVGGYLDQHVAAGDPVGADDYFVQVLEGHHPVESELHRAVRSRGVETAAAGPAGLATDIDRAIEKLDERLGEPGATTRRIRVLGDTCMTVDDYLRTRIVELVVHIDDLSTSLDLPVPELPETAYTVCTDVLARIAVTLRGGRDAVRLLARPTRTDTSFGAM